jgi:AcrR family transcriptional regulator
VTGALEAAGPRRWRRLEPDARREQILECAVRVFGERPYSAVSTGDIAAAAGVARGLLNHYFGTKRELYLEVVRTLVTITDLPGADVQVAGTLRTRVERSVDWFLDVVGEHGKAFVAVTGAGGVGADPEVERILAEADDAAASRVLELVGLPAHRPEHRAVIRAYGGLVKAAIREWARDETLDRAQVHRLLARTLETILRDVLPGPDRQRNSTPCASGSSVE